MKYILDQTTSIWKTAIHSLTRITKSNSCPFPSLPDESPRPWKKSDAVGSVGPVGPRDVQNWVRLLETTHVDRMDVFVISNSTNANTRNPIEIENVWYQKNIGKINRIRPTNSVPFLAPSVTLHSSDWRMNILKGRKNMFPLKKLPNENVQQTGGIDRKTDPALLYS